MKTLIIKLGLGFMILGFIFIASLFAHLDEPLEFESFESKTEEAPPFLIAFNF